MSLLRSTILFNRSTLSNLTRFNSIQHKQLFRFPRINRETLLPVATNMNSSESECWYPPGHGDIYQSFYDSGLLDKFIEQGKEYMFLSNIDNLGATVDIR